MSTKRRKKQTFTAVEMLRIIKAAHAAEAEFVLIPTKEGLRAHFPKPGESTITNDNEEGDYELEGLE